MSTPKIRPSEYPFSGTPTATPRTDAAWNASFDLPDFGSAGTARAMREECAKLERELADWSVLNLWGGTPEIIHQFVRGQQARIHAAQNTEAERAEAALLFQKKHTHEKKKRNRPNILRWRLRWRSQITQRPRGHLDQRSPNLLLGRGGDSLAAIR